MPALDVSKEGAPNASDLFDCYYCDYATLTHGLWQIASREQSLLLCHSSKGLIALNNQLTEDLCPWLQIKHFAPILNYTGNFV
jgi:hypothetical protein